MAALSVAGSFVGSDCCLISSIARRMVARDIGSAPDRLFSATVPVGGVESARLVAGSAESCAAAESCAPADWERPLSTGDAAVFWFDRVRTPKTTIALTITAAKPAITGTLERLDGATSMLEEIIVGAVPTRVAGTCWGAMMLVFASVATVCGMRSTDCQMSRPNSDALA
jgi:hypothetical protein